jgi:serine/threonine protein kinase
MLHLKISKMTGTNPTDVFHYVDMDVASDDLKSFISKTKRSGSPRNVLQIMSAITRAVRFVHDHGIIVRDLQPSRGMVLRLRS